MALDLHNKNILITGGTGSIGSEIVKQVLRGDPKTVRILSRDESKQFFFSQQLKEHKNVRFLIGDIRDRARLQFAMEGIDIVFHAAALKHVPACEYNPFEAVKTNVMGTQNVIETALEVNCEKVISISTDKVAHPSNTMGATKLVAERLIAAANYYRGNRQTVFSCVRFGNVLGSRGSVIPLFIEQIAKKRRITVTDPEMTRFFMSIQDAVHLVLQAAEKAKGGETFILKMPVIKLADLAEVIIEETSALLGIHPEEVTIEQIGVRPGEKVYEELMTRDEAARAKEEQDMFIVTPYLTEHSVEDTETHIHEYSSSRIKPLDKNAVSFLLKHLVHQLWRNEFSYQH